MTRLARFARFNVVAVIGRGVQLGTVMALTHGRGIDAVPASALGVAAAVLHNFIWHLRWTWRDRMSHGLTTFAAFTRFAGLNGVVSLAGTVALMPALVGAAALDAVAANVITIAACGILNFVLADRLCFADPNF